jgi:HD-GYP domain-containing protein (c-di-GMP phosphodiesterase class II)
MAENKKNTQSEASSTPLSKILLMPDGKSLNKTCLEILLHDDMDIPILCVNRETDKKRNMPFKALYHNNNHFLQQDGSWEYYLSSEDLKKIMERASARRGNWNDEKPKTEQNEEKVKGSDTETNTEADTGFGKEYETFSSMPVKEKINSLSSSKERLNSLIGRKPKDNAVVTEALVDTARNAALINHTVIEEAMQLGDEEAKKLTRGLVAATQEMVNSSVNLLSDDVFNNELMNTLVEKSNGTIVQHMTRVYLNGLSFLSYYNKLISTSSAINKLRISFSLKYRNFYHALMPHIDEDKIILERVFLGGMRAISTELLQHWAVGFLVHDVGKASAVEYHEGEAAYDRNVVIEHVKLGYKSIINKTNYPKEASLITGYHHEYYGDPSGYGYYRAYLDRFKKTNQSAKQDYCITFELKPILEFEALAYFPAKVLEIIDVYDSVTDPNRTYRKALSPEDAIAMMRTEFIEKHHKLDPILFDLFAGFIQEKHKK